MSKASSQRSGKILILTLVALLLTECRSQLLGGMRDADPSNCRTAMSKITDSALNSFRSYTIYSCAVQVVAGQNFFISVRAPDSGKAASGVADCSLKINYSVRGQYSLNKLASGANDCYALLSAAASKKELQTSISNA